MKFFISSATVCIAWSGCRYSTSAVIENPSSTTVAPTDATVGETRCDMNAYCQSMAGPRSYCKDWQTISSCFGADNVTECVNCGVGAITPETTVTPTISTTLVGHGSAAQARAGCGSLSVSTFLWVEQPSNLKTKSEFVAFYQELNTFISHQNCVNIDTTTLVIRTPNPKYPISSAGGMYWPPGSSPLFTELISPLGSVGRKVKILLYPYIMEDYDRDVWVDFAAVSSLKPVIASLGLTVYDGVFAYTKGWQDFVGKSQQSVSIDGFMLDYEEIFKAMGTSNRVSLTSASFSPYRAAYPTIKTATTVGYDNSKDIVFFDAFMDYLHLQVYDLYYPYVGSDESSNDSIFETTKNNPQGLVAVLLSKVLTPTILKAYKGRESKIKLMWSTQTLASRNCLYPLRDGSCGINYEFNWSPDKFNEFLGLVTKAPELGQFEHGIYTYNFMPRNWV